MKKCSACSQEKEASEFWKRTISPDGLAYICKACDAPRYMRKKRKNPEEIAAKQKEWRDNNKKRIRDVKRNSKYGLSGEEADRMREEQFFACAICRRHESLLGKRGLVIDHDHKTDKIRGLLCDKCNRCLGLLDDSVDIIESAVRYLRKYQK